ncbi:MAG: metal-binding protein, partial [Mesorhizobium sp.]
MERDSSFPADRADLPSGDDDGPAGVTVIVCSS